LLLTGDRIFKLLCYRFSFYEISSKTKRVNKNRNANAIANCRWDVQRIREQRQVERLKQREMASARRGSGGSTGRHGDGEEPLSSLWPQLDDAEYLEVTESIPVAAFGLPITKFAARYVKKHHLWSVVR
jgi:hypothetical protein